MSESDSEVNKILQKEEFLKKKRKEYNRKNYENSKKKKKEATVSINNFYTSSCLNTVNESLCENICEIETEYFNIIDEASYEKNNLNESIFELSFNTTHESLNSSYSSVEEIYEQNTKDNQFIYLNATTTISEFTLSLLALKQKHKFSETATDDILNLIKLLLPENKLPKNSGKLFSNLKNSIEIIKEHKICKKCDKIKEESNENQCKTCQSDLISFSTFEIQPQLEKILNNDSYLEQIKSANKKRDNQFINNALDGQIYSHANINNKSLNVSLNISADGAPLIKSRNHSLWPVSGNIVELNQACREKFENIILFGLWLHNSKPTNKFFSKSLELLENILNKELIISNQIITVRCQLALFDSPAKAALANIKQFNGFYGCPSCFHPGKHTDYVHLYPIDKIYKLKTNEDYKLYSDLADQLNIDKIKKESVFGFFGKSPLDKIIKIPEQLPYDYMHLVLQGHAKYVYSKLLTDRYLDEIYIGNNIDTINNILKSIQMPHIIQRKPYDIHEITKWKSNEIKNFLFYQSVPIFINIFKSNEQVSFLYKYISYVIAIRILYSPIKNLDDLTVAEDIISNYLISLEETFGLHAYTFTAHAHLHLTDQVRLHGPLQSHSMFFFEGSIFNLKNLIHGSRGFINQICKQIFLYKDLKSQIKEQNFSNNNLFQFIERKVTFNNKCLPTRLYGKIEKTKLKDNLEALFYTLFNVKIDSIVKSDRAYLNKKLFHSKLYSRKGKSNSFTISYFDQSHKLYADIEFFFQYNNQIYAVITKHLLKKINDNVLPKSSGFFYEITMKYFSVYFKLIEKSNLNHIININVIHSRCIIIENNKDILLTELEYEFEHD